MTTEAELSVADRLAQVLDHLGIERSNEAEPSYRYFRGRRDRTRTTREVGATIRKLREAKGITQDQVASAVGMMRNNISRIEAAKHRPTLETLERIAKALKVSVAELIVPR